MDVGLGRSHFHAAGQATMPVPEQDLLPDLGPISGAVWEWVGAQLPVLSSVFLGG